MTRDAISLPIADISAFARALKRETDDDAGHQIWLNRVARAAGFRNFQHLCTVRKGAAPPADARAVERALRHFDEAGRMATWPSRTQVQKLCLWAIWAGIPKGETFTERQISARIDKLTGFGDAAIVRRTLVELGLLTRERDGSAYLRVEQPPPPEARELIRHVRQKAPG